MSKIEWTDKTINPVVGCTKISEGCQNCYAEVMAKRLAGIEATKEKYSGVVDENGWTGKVNFDLEVMMEVLKNKKPTRYFVGSMTDLFHENVKVEWLDHIFAVIMAASWHTFFVLTKRPERMREYFSEQGANERVLGLSKKMVNQFILQGIRHPKHTQEGSNLWLGVTAENQEMADQRIPILLDTLAAHRFVSVEPMLGKVDLTGIELGEKPNRIWYDSLCGTLDKEQNTDIDFIAHLDWVICGGESGRNARQLKEEWIKELYSDCRCNGTPFFFKQWGEFDEFGERVGKKKSGRLIDDAEVMEYPDGVNVEVAE